MIVADLTRRMMPGMPVWPGDPPLNAVPAADAGRDGCAVTRVTLGTHCGTHMDAPAHVLPGGRTLDRFPPERFLGWAVTARSSRRPTCSPSWNPPSGPASCWSTPAGTCTGATPTASPAIRP